MYAPCTIYASFAPTFLITYKTTGLTGEVYGAQNAFHSYSTTSVGKISRSEKYVVSYARNARGDT
jgi:hypothetical protein